MDAVVSANDKAIAPTDIAVAMPEGTYGRIAPGSGLAAKHHLAVGSGVTDADYRGNVRVVLFNHGNTWVFFTNRHPLHKTVTKQLPCQSLVVLPRY